MSLGYRPFLLEDTWCDVKQKSNSTTGPTILFVLPSSYKNILLNDIDFLRQLQFWVANLLHLWAACQFDHAIIGAGWRKMSKLQATPSIVKFLALSHLHQALRCQSVYFVKLLPCQLLVLVSPAQDIALQLLGSPTRYRVNHSPRILSPFQEWQSVRFHRLSTSVELIVVTQS